MPHHLLGYFGAPYRSRPANATKEPPVRDTRRGQPIVNGPFNPGGDRNRSNVTGFANQIDDGPMILSALEMINGEFG